MSTERQQQASRANGSKSRGAVTPEGKLASSRNALKHGFLSGTIVLQCESTDRFDQLVATLYEEFQPQTPFEESLIDNMAVARWRQMRIWGMEKAGMEHEMRRQLRLSNSISAEDSATRASLAFRTLSDDGRSIELINRYDSRYERQYYRAHRRFLEVRDHRTPPSTPAATKQPTATKGERDEGTFPTTGSAKIHEMPAPANVEVSKRTPEVTENKPVSSGSVPPSTPDIHPLLSVFIRARRLLFGTRPMFVLVRQEIMAFDGRA